MPTLYPADKGSGLQSEATPATTPKGKLLERIRKRFDHHALAWREIFDAAELDQRALSINGPWDPEDRAQRLGGGPEGKYKRPCLHLDQLSQHVNALINEVRSNPISVKVSPAGEGANENTAQLRADRIRAIEYECNATQAYQTAFEAAASWGFGAFGLQIVYKSWDSTQRVIKVRRFANSFAILPDPDTKEADFSDMRDCFVLDRVPKDEFQVLFPEAEIVNFGEEQVKIAPSWLDDDSIQIAEYWYVEKKKRRLLYVENADKARAKFWADELEGFKVDGDVLVLKDGSVAGRVLIDEKREQPTIKMCLTNGLEILDESEWEGKSIPVYPVIGKEKFVREGKKVTRVIDSYIRMARDGQMLFDYYKTNEAEVVGMSPKTPWIGYAGQFEGHDEWETLNRDPRAYAEVNPVMDATGDAVLPLPQRQIFEPPVQALEVGAESARRAIQSAIGSYGVTRLDDTNVKSGKALQELKASNNMAAFHFIDNYKIMLRRVGRDINDLLDNVEGGEQIEVGIRKADETQETVKLNQADAEGKVARYSLTDESQHEVTISTGPAYESQREQGAAFSDSIVANLEAVTQVTGPEKAAKLLAQSIRLKNLGPVGDEMVEIIDPKQEEGAPEQAMAAAQQMQQELETTKAFSQQLFEENKQLKAGLQVKLREIESHEKIAAMQDETKLKIAAMNAGVKADQVDLENEIDVLKHHDEMRHASRQEDLAERQAEQAAEAAKAKSEAKEAQK